MKLLQREKYEHRVSCSIRTVTHIIHEFVPIAAKNDWGCPSALSADRKEEGKAHTFVKTVLLIDIIGFFLACMPGIYISKYTMSTSERRAPASAGKSNGRLLTVEKQPIAVSRARDEKLYLRKLGRNNGGV